MPLYYVGDTTRISWFKESGTYAEISGAAIWVGRTTEFTPTESEGFIEQRFVGGGDRSINNFVLGPSTYTGRLVYNPQDFQLLAYAFGLVSTSGTYTHTISELNSTGTFPSFAIEEGKVGPNTTLSRTCRGVMIDNFQITARQGEPVACELDLIIQDVSGGAAVTSVTSGTKVPFLWSDTRGINVSGTALGLTGDLAEITEQSWRLSNSTAATHYVRESRLVGKPIPSNRMYETRVTMHMTEGTGTQLWNTYKNGSEFNADFWITRTGSAATSGNDYLNVWMSGCVMTEASHPAPFENVIEQTLLVKPKTCGAIVTDGVTSYETFF